ncbi:MAG: hypothetical protein LBM71_01430, partial [Elusimicrobiota bacterium]|nr:hypothetical protein [Elusimicrobiota bacterium]
MFELDLSELPPQCCCRLISPFFLFIAFRLRYATTQQGSSCFHYDAIKFQKRLQKTVFAFLPFNSPAGLVSWRFRTVHKIWNFFDILCGGLFELDLSELPPQCCCR